MRNFVKQFLYFMSFIVGILLLWNVSFSFDNKYNTKMPLPEEVKSGKRTWIGEFSNYRWNNEPSLSPYGSCTYQLKINYSGKDMPITLYFPNLCHSYSLYWDDTLLSKGYAKAEETFILLPGTHVITLNVSGNSGYYTGMYFPGAIGSVKTIRFMIQCQTTCYGIALLLSLFLLLFCFSLWARSGNKLRKYFAFFCLSFCFSLSHYFMQFLNFPVAQYRFLISDIAFYCMMYFAIALMTEAGNVKQDRFQLILRTTSFFLPLVEILLYLIAPLWHDAIRLHGMLQNIYRIFLFAYLLWGCIYFSTEKNRTLRLLFVSDCALGIGLLINLLSSNLFEPAYTLWQFEWCSLVLIFLFAMILEEHNRTILLENQTYQEHLSDLVNERTAQLNCLLEERRAFFSDMAHDLKAPLASMKSLIEIIRSHNVGLDSELLLYLELVECQHQKMSSRVSSLNELNALDRLTTEAQPLLLSVLFHELYQTHNPEAVVAGIHFILQPVTQPLTLFVQKKKILLVFENLFYNALRFTSCNGTISVTFNFDEENIILKFSDTGQGIPETDLPHIFKRFYMGKNGEETGGSGLGLYIVKSVIEEHGGSITVESKLGKGTIFTILLSNYTKTISRFI